MPYYNDNRDSEIYYIIFLVYCRGLVFVICHYSSTQRLLKYFYILPETNRINKSKFYRYFQVRSHYKSAANIL